MPRVIILMLSLLLLLNPPVLAQSAEDIQLRPNPAGHTSKINKLLVTPEGQVLTASNDKTIQVWDMEQGQLREQRKILGQLGLQRECSRGSPSLQMALGWPVEVIQSKGYAYMTSRQGN